MECKELIAFQCASGPHEQLLDIGVRLHAPMFSDYRAVRGLPADWPLGRHPNWLKAYWLRKLLRECPLGTVLLYLDVDTRIRKHVAVPLRDGVEFAAARNVWDQFNVGVMFWRVTERTRRAIEAIWKDGPPLQYPAEDQIVFNHYVQGLRRQELTNEWNAYRGVKGRPHPDPIIESWHGEPLHVALRGLQDVG